MRGGRKAGLVLAAAVLLVAAAGGVVAIAVGKAAGWLDGSSPALLQIAGTSAPPGQSGDPAIEIRERGDFDAAEIYRLRSAGVVTIYALFPGHEAGDPSAAAQGAGFVVSPQGHVLTSSHVITTSDVEATEGEVVEAEEIFVEFGNGDRVRGTIVGFDLFNDVGVLKIDPDEHALSPVPLGDSSKVVVGDPVAAIGSPFGQQNSLAVGVVSATERRVDSLTSDYSVIDAIQTDAPITHGNSGGPLFNAQGEVIGINAQIRTDSGGTEGVGFAIPINSARRSLEQLLESGRVEYAWIGIQAQTISPLLARELDLPKEGGAAIQSVLPGSPADKGGFRGGTTRRQVLGITLNTGGDIIVAINGISVRSTEDLIRIVASELLPGQTAQFTAVRDGRRITIPIVLEDRPPNPEPG